MNKLKFYSIFILGFSIYFYLDAAYFSYLQKEVLLLTKSKSAAHVFAYTVTLIPLLITTLLLKKSKQSLFNSFGLSRGIIIGLIFAFTVTLPMLIGYAIKFKINTDLSPDTVFINTLSSAFFEEIIYRAFLFGMLYRFTQLGFLLSVFFGSLLFGVIHLYQASNISETIGVFLITFLGSLFFSWIYAEWKFNLWAAIFLHCLMNLYWLVFNVDEIAIGGMYANIFRFSVLLIAITITIFYKRKQKIPLKITRKTLWMKSQEELQ
ncbi:MAG: CPBP family intramembrane metalloprotease [Candidatus Chryseobacterium colombiense]|nr:CPBP family intramembrane glutamic endopeptidase [Chryseobacterium sp.]WEK71205.1 MAG: CPBP family intramembrane metalloprotease [Chryseobacterium sp.]